MLIKTKVRDFDETQRAKLPLKCVVIVKKKYTQYMVSFSDLLNIVQILKLYGRRSKRAPSNNIY